MSAAFEPGTVLHYPYLWHWQDAQGETEGRKDRPVAVAVLFVGRDGQDYVLLLPLTTQKPAERREAIEIPATEKARAALDQNRSQWLMLDEYNLDPVKGSYYLRQSAVTGQFSKAFMRTVLEQFRGLFPQAKRVARHP